MKAFLNWLLGLFKSAQKVDDSIIPDNPEVNNNPEVTDEEAEMCLLIYTAFTKEIGINEYTQAGRKRIDTYHATTNAKGMGYKTAWCSSLMNYICKILGFYYTKKAAARSWEKAGLKKINKPIKGCIVVFWRDSKNSGLGHVGCYDSDAGDSVRVLGGNQSNSVCKANYPKSRLIGYYIPKKA